jgi:biofilm protein TabA
MILDRLENSARYEFLGKRFARAFELLKTGNLTAKEAGNYEVDGKKLYYMVQNYTTKPTEERRFESHRIYADIQVVFSGREAMGLAPVTGLAVQTLYDSAKDIIFFETPADYTELKMVAGEFVVLFPGEAHMPQCHWGGPAQVSKIVFKVSLEE